MLSNLLCSYRFLHIVILICCSRIHMGILARRICLQQMTNKCLILDLKTDIINDRNFSLTGFNDKITIVSPKNSRPGRTAYQINGNGSAIHIQSNFSGNEPISSSSACSDDYLELWDLKHEYYLLGAFCANESVDIVSYSDKVVMVFLDATRTNGTKRFDLSVTKTSCGQSALRCPSNKTICVQQEGICDGRNDCPAGEDEICTVDCGLPAIKTYFVPVPPRETPRPDVKKRIMGGTEAIPKSWPWQVFLRTYQTRPSNSFVMCGGSMIGPQWVLTAGHCCHYQDGNSIDARNFDVIVGIQDRRLITKSMTKSVRAVFVHPLFQPEATANFPFMNYDFCLLQLAKPVRYSAEVQPVCLPHLSPPPVGATCFATGFGDTATKAEGKPTRDFTSQVLRQVDLELIDMTECVAAFQGMLSPEMVCGAGIKKDACRGDSGGPFVCQVPDTSPAQWQLVGLTSFGRVCASENPGIYARISRAMPFLIQVLYDAKFEGWLPTDALESRSQASAASFNCYTHIIVVIFSCLKVSEWQFSNGY